MNLRTTLYVTLGLLLVLAIVAVGAWFYAQFANPSGNEPGEDRGIFSSLFPFATDGGLGGIFSDDTEDEELGPVPALRQVSTAEVAGAGFATGLHGGLSIRYIERYTGHTYETPVDSLTVTRLTNTTVPAVQHALWVSASSTVLSFLGEDERVENFVGTFSGTSTDQELRGDFLPLYDRITFDNTGKLLGLIKTPTGSTLDIIDVATLVIKPHLSSPIGSWVPLSGGARWYLQSAPTAFAGGTLYDITDGSLQVKLRNITGLQVSMNPSGTHALVSSGGVNVVRSYIYSMNDDVLTLLPQGTLADKCAWGNNRLVLCGVPKSLPEGPYPDNWLLGRMHTSDDLWYIDSETNVITVAMELETQAGEPMDVSQIVVSPDGNYAVFVNRNDQTLWVATLTPQ